jgi:hypothetical protein
LPVPEKPTIDVKNTVCLDLLEWMQVNRLVVGAGLTDASGKCAGNGILAIKEAKANCKIEARVKEGQVGNSRGVEPSFKGPD